MSDRDMTGRTVVITGASAGLGAIGARRLAELGATVVPVGRSPEKTAAVARDLGVEPLIADFARLADVRALAEAILDRCPQIDVLANNAGGLFPTRTITEDGNELTFQVNHLAPFLLTGLLRERLESTPGARVVGTSSVANRFGRINLDDVDLQRSRWFGFRAYANGKLENILFTRELTLRFAGVHAVCFHPGPVASEFGRDSFTTGLLYRTPLRRVFLISPEKGAAPLVSLASRDDIDEYDGVYFDRHQPHGATSSQANDPALARALWERSAQLTGLGA